METKQIRYEIFLNHLTLSERLSNRADFNEYKETVVSMLQYSNKFLYENTILEVLTLELRANGNNEPLTMEEVEVAYPERFVRDLSEEKEERIWFDLIANEYIYPSNELFYDIFFVYKLRSLNLLEIDPFLEYQLAKHGNNLDKFIRFVQLAIRKDVGKLLSRSHILTVTEWANEKEKQTQTSLSGIEKIKIKGKCKREAEDNATALNQEQTALLIHFLQQVKIIRKDENLNNKEAGQAFSILTGYSADTLRQSLGKTDLEQIATKKNLAQVDSVLSHLATLIDNKILARK